MADSVTVIDYGVGNLGSVARAFKRLDVDVFVVGHQAQPHGWCQAGDNLIILASDHNHGCLADINLTKSWSAAELANHIVPLASIS